MFYLFQKTTVLQNVFMFHLFPADWPNAPKYGDHATYKNIVCLDLQKVQQWATKYVLSDFTINYKFRLGIKNFL